MNRLTSTHSLKAALYHPVDLSVPFRFVAKDIDVEKITHLTDTHRNGRQYLSALLWIKSPSCVL